MQANNTLEDKMKKIDSLGRSYSTGKRNLLLLEFG